MKSVNNLVACLICFSLCLLLSFSISFSQINNWPQFRGPNCSGIADKNAKPPIELNDKTILWKTALPIGHSSPCIWEDNIFLTAFIKEKSELQTICIDRISGNIKWKQSIFPDTIEGYHAVSNAAQSSPTTDGERVYVYFGSYGVLCYSVVGDLLWDYKINIHQHRWGVATSPVLYEEKLILSRDIEGELYLIALDKVKGETIWKADLIDLKRPNPPSATPIIYYDQIILHRANQVAAYSITDGNQIWSFSIKTNGITTPVLQGNIIYISTYHNFSSKDSRGNFPRYHNFENALTEFDNNNDGLIQKDELPDTLYVFDRPEISDIPDEKAAVSRYFGTFDKNKNESIDSTEWKITVDYVLSLEQDAGLIALKPESKKELPFETMIWRELEKAPEVPSPICYKGYVYMCKNGGILTCMNEQNGTIQYRERIGAKGPYFSSPVVADDNIYIPSGNGIVTVIKAGDKFDILAQNDLKEEIYASPAIVGNTIYIRTMEYLYAFGQN